MVDTRRDTGTFANTAFEGSIQPSVALQNPVENNAGAALFNAVGEGIANSADHFKAAVAQSHAPNYSVLTNYEDEVNGIADAVDQGKYTVQQARMKLRSTTNQYVANYPSMISDITSLQGKLTGDNGIANVIRAGTDDQQRAKDFQDKAYAAGYPDVPSYQAHLRAANNLEDVKNDLATKQANYDQMTLIDKNKGYQALTGFMSTGLPALEGTIQKYQSLIDQSNKDPAIVAQAITGLQSEYAKMTGFVGELRGLSGGADKDADPSFLLTGANNMVQAFVDFNSGKTSKDVYDTKLAAGKTQAELTFLQSDPRTSKLVAASQLLNTNLSDIANPLYSTTNDVLKKFLNLEQGSTSDKPEDVIDSTKATVTTLSDLSSSIQAVGDKPTPDQLKSINTALTNNVRSLGVYGATASNPKDLNAVINFLANPVNGKYFANNAVPKQFLDQAQDALGKEYGDVVLPLIRERWDQAMTLRNNPAFKSISQTPMRGETSPSTPPEIITPVWNGSGVQFLPGPGLQKDSRVVAEAASLNKDVASVLNTYVRAATHLAGNNNYQSFYQTNLAERLFGDKAPAQTMSPSQSITSMSNGSDLTAGMRNNNPGNIKFSDINWKGQVGPSTNKDQGDPQVVFDSVESGMRATAKNVLSKFHGGADTIRELISAPGGWTPGYTPGAEGVAKASGFNIDQHLNMNDPAVLAKVIRGIVTQEHGPASRHYTDEMINQGINAALGF